MIGTFGYKGQHYLSKDLIDFCQHKTPTDFYVSESFLKNMKIGHYWPKFKQTEDTPEKIPMDMFDLIKHVKRMFKADYSYPIIMYKNTILDGVHRVAHAAFDQVQKIPCVVLSEEEMQKFIRLYKPYEIKKKSDSTPHISL
jgi:hypothetical protein|nr:MAG TPA: hypothetical protein [Caudoviricetes sp.]